MKFPSKTLALLMASIFTLTACGGDKPSEPAPTPAPSEPADTPANESTEQAPSTDNAPPAENAETPEADKASDDNKANQDTATISTEQNSDKPVQALSIEEGKKRYEATCKICHDQGLLDAPKLTDKANWAKRLDKGIDTLHTHSAKGFGKMPAQAVDDVSEAEVYAAVDYMVSQVK